MFHAKTSSVRKKKTRQAFQLILISTLFRGIIVPHRTEGVHYICLCTMQYALARPADWNTFVASMQQVLVRTPDILCRPMYTIGYFERGLCVYILYTVFPFNSSCVRLLTYTAKSATHIRVAFTSSVQKESYITTHSVRKRKGYST